MLEKTYQPADIETRLYQQWESTGAFAAGARAGGTHQDGKPYTIVIPPPNVTGSLHMGHALNNSLQDVLIRFARMRGADALWQPGTDHAGIATQMVVERQLAEQGQSRHDLGREKFVERVWQWKEESGGTITQQLRRLGASCDWSRERFTMDAGLSAAVLKVFVELYKQDLIYKDNRLVNWDPKLHTAISDLEVVSREINGHLWYIRYPIAGQQGRSITVATTRPETMLGDTAIAVHPDDERHQDLIGQYAELPLVGRKLIIVADDYADPEQGSGAVKITPAHDFNDFEVGRRHDLEVINILDANAALNDAVPEPYRGLDRFEARKRIVADLEAAGFLDHIEDHTHMVPYGDRSEVVVEPWLTEQWYVDAKTLAQPAIKSVTEGRTKFVPENWSKTYFEWLNNIQPWCVSRQLWWGHQIPAWYGPDGHIFVELDEAAALAAAAEHYGAATELTRDPDVLDTWFSSALWPFSTLGWPEQTPELDRYYPTDVLVTGFDIIFFWVARMMMMGLHFTGQEPFHTVYINAMVRDERGAKMSKSKGNVIDPMGLADTYGVDALRFTLIAMSALGRGDIKLSDKRVEGYRNFATKLWNAARFCQLNECAPAADFDPSGTTQAVNRWIVASYAAAARDVTKALEEYRFDAAANAVYHFTWHTFCDWFVEFIKPMVGAEAGPDVRAETRATAAWVLQGILRLLHPFMPYVTEELWTEFGDGNGMLISADWAPSGPELDDSAAMAEIDWVVRFISEVRTVRSLLNVPAGARIPATFTAEAGDMARLATNIGPILRLARLTEVTPGDAPAGAIQTVLDQGTIGLAVADVIDLAAERKRLEDEIKRLEGDIKGIDKKLANQAFVAKAPAAVVEEQHTRRANAADARDRLAAALTRLPA